MGINYKKANIERKRRERAKLCRDISAMPSEKALDAILDHETPASLVQSFSHEDLYFLMYDIGKDDFLPILSLASSEQWEFFLDLEVWKDDRLDIQTSVRWIGDLMKADPQRTVNWLFWNKLEFLEFVISKNIEVKIREHDQDPGELGDGFETFDDQFYFKVLDEPVAVDGDGWDISTMSHDERKQIVYDFLLKLLNTDYLAYQGVLLESTSIIYAETEEEHYRLKNVRLAEKGFLPYEEALGIYAIPIEKEPVLKKRNKKNDQEYLFVGEEDDTQVVPYFHFGEIEEGSLFASALYKLSENEKNDIIQPEFAALCNQVISADKAEIKGRDELVKIVRKVCGYLSIGIECLDDEAKLNCLKYYPLKDLFNLGHSLIGRLKIKAEKWLSESWFRSVDLTLNFWDEYRMGVLGGLFIKRPLLYDNFRRGSLYRDFEKLEEINAAEKTVDEIIFYDLLFSKMEVDIEPFADYFLTYKRLLLTMWVNGDAAYKPLDVGRFKEFFINLWEKKSGTENRRISLKSKEDFINWLSIKTGISMEELSDRGAKMFEALFDEIETELSMVKDNAVDPRFINMFCILPDEDAE